MPSGPLSVRVAVLSEAQVRQVVIDTVAELLARQSQVSIQPPARFAVFAALRRFAQRLFTSSA